MVRWNPWSTRGPIGLDIGGRYIKAAQVAGDGPQARLAAAAVFERLHPGQPFDEGEARRLRAVLDRRGFTGRSVVAAAPGTQVMSSVLQMPPRDSGAPLERIARAEMGRAHRSDPEALEVAFWEIPAPARAPEGVPMMAVACPHAAAEGLLDLLEAQGLSVNALDLGGWAMARACAPLLAQEPGIVTAVDLGWQTVTLVLLHEQTMIYKRTMGGVGLGTLVESAHHDTRLDPKVIDYLLGDIGFLEPPADADADWRKLAHKVRGPLELHFEQVAQELRLSLGYAAHQYPDAAADRLLLMGGGAAIPGLAEHLGACLEARVAVVRPADVCDRSPMLHDEATSPAMTAALGLAMHPLEVTA